MTIGIYDIYNKVRDKHYFGQSVNIERRWKHHRNNLQNNKHINPKLQHAWNKYGKASFEFHIVEQLPSDKKLLFEREDFWIESHDSIDNGYNIWGGMESTTGYKHSKDVIDFIRKMKSKPVIQFTINGTLKGLYPSARAAERNTGIHAENITTCCRGEVPSAGGFVWFHEKEYIENGVSFKKQPARNYKPKRRICQLNGEFQCVAIYDTLKAAARAVGSQHCAVRQACLGNNFVVKGFFFIYEADFKDEMKFNQFKEKAKNRFVKRPVERIDGDGNVVVYESINAAARDVKRNNMSIIQCLKGISKQSGGYQWRYAV